MGGRSVVRAEGTIMARMYLALAFAGALLAMSQEASAQICRPVAERTAELGCWIVANGQLGNQSKPEVFWQLDIFPTRAAADVAKTPSRTVVEVQIPPQRNQADRPLRRPQRRAMTLS